MVILICHFTAWTSRVTTKNIVKLHREQRQRLSFLLIFLFIDKMIITCIDFSQENCDVENFPLHFCSSSLSSFTWFVYLQLIFRSFGKFYVLGKFCTQSSRSWKYANSLARAHVCALQRNITENSFIFLSLKWSFLSTFPHTSWFERKST